MTENSYCTEHQMSSIMVLKNSAASDARISRYLTRHSSRCETKIDRHGGSDMLFVWFQESVNVSLTNLLTFPWVKEKVIAKKLSLHGGFYDFVEGSFQVWDFDVTISHSKKF